MAEGIGKLGDEIMVGDSRLAEDDANRLCRFYSANKNPPDAYDDLLIMFSGSDDVKVAHTAAQVTAYCEDSNVSFVFILPSSYSFSATIAHTSDKKIVGLGDVQLDWAGAAGGYMFNNASAGNVMYEGLHFVKTGNAYKPVALRAGTVHSDVMRHCLVEDTGDDLEVLSNYVTIEHCEIYTSLLIDNNASFVTVTRCYFEDPVLIKDCMVNYFNMCNFRDTVTIYKGSGYTSTYTLLTFSACDFVTGDPSVKFDLDGAGAATIKVVKFMGCLFWTTNDCVQVANEADLTVDDVLYQGCYFNAATDAYEILNGTQNRWRFVANQYESITNRRNFSGGTQNDFSDVMDGL